MNLVYQNLYPYWGWKSIQDLSMKRSIKGRITHFSSLVYVIYNLEHSFKNRLGPTIWTGNQNHWYSRSEPVIGSFVSLTCWEREQTSQVSKWTGKPIDVVTGYWTEFPNLIFFICAALLFRSVHNSPSCLNLLQQHTFSICMHNS